MAPPAKVKPLTPQQQQDDHQLLQQLQQQQKDQQQAFELDQKRKENRRTAERFVDHFGHLLELKATRWRICARAIGSAYATAAQNHRDALQKADKVKALDAQLLFSAITMMMTGGVSMIFSALALEEAHKLLGNLAKDTSLQLVGEAFSASGPPAVTVSPRPTPPQTEPPKTTSDDAVDVEPLRYQNSLENKIDAWRRDALQFIIDRENQIDALPLEKWDNFDELAFQKLFDTVWDKLPLGMSEKTSEKDIDDMARDLERAMWAVWMPRLKTVQYFWTRPVYVGEEPELRPSDSYEGVKGPVEDRFKALNILQEAGTTISMWHSAESEDTKLIAWADRFTKTNHPVWNN
jgi:hypothetical protein